MPPVVPAREVLQSALAPESDLAFGVGHVIDGKYRLTAHIGSGGMGTVFCAEHTVLGKRYALKFLRSDVVARPSAVRRFEREAGLLGRLEHENVVNLVDVGGNPNERRYLVLEFIAGHTLRHELASGPLAPARASKILMQVARGLAAAHDAGVIHRDLKPENVMLTRHADGRLLVKLLDFGVACLSDTDESLTATGQAPGTASYMSPEQARGDAEVDARSDVFALGVIAYEALCGVRPFDGNSYNETLFRVLNVKHVPVSTRRAELPPRVDAVLDRALAKEVRDRFGSPWEFVTALQNTLRDDVESIAQADETDRQTSPELTPLDTASEHDAQRAVVSHSAELDSVNRALEPVAVRKRSHWVPLGVASVGLLGIAVGWMLASSAPSALKDPTAQSLEQPGAVSGTPASSVNVLGAAAPVASENLVPSAASTSAVDAVASAHPRDIARSAPSRQVRPALEERDSRGLVDVDKPASANPSRAEAEPRSDAPTKGTTNAPVLRLSGDYAENPYASGKAGAGP